MSDSTSVSSPMPGVELKSPSAAKASAPTELPTGKVVPQSGKSSPASEIRAVRMAAEQMNNFLSENARDLRFQVDEDSGRTVITVLNPKTGEVIRRIPPEELIAAAWNFDGRGPVILDQQV